jgi:hypothetical protein
MKFNVYQYVKNMETDDLQGLYTDMQANNNK